MCLIIANTIVLATDKFPPPEEDLIRSTNLMFTILFAAECVIKLIGLTIKEWKNDIFNVFDLLIVIASFIEMAISDRFTAIVGALRSVRLLRLFKLARSNYNLKCLLDAIGITILQCANFIVILSIFVYVFSLLGMEMFAGKLVHSPEFELRSNYDEIVWAIITVFEVLVGDQWNQVMYMVYISTGS